MVRLILIGIVMIPAGITLIVMALRGDGVFPQGIWQGPIIIVLGLALIVIGGRQLLKTDDPPESNLSGATDLADDETESLSGATDLSDDETETADGPTWH